MTEITPADIDFDTDVVWDPTQESRPRPLRLEHLPEEVANKPTGRGTKTAAARGYDVEYLARIIYDGTRDGVSWYDVSHGESPEFRTECKSCIDEYPCGVPGTFKIWKPYHRKLMGCHHEFSDTIGVYFFLIYTVRDDTAYEIGKFTVDPLTIEALIDGWRHEYHDTMGWEYCRELSWTRLLSELDLQIADLRAEEVVLADCSPDSPSYGEAVDPNLAMSNPFRSRL